MLSVTAGRVRYATRYVHHITIRHGRYRTRYGSGGTARRFPSLDLTPERAEWGSGPAQACVPYHSMFAEVRESVAI